MEMLGLWIILILCLVGLALQFIFASYVILNWISKGGCDDFFEALGDYPK
jgi:hypothetical protein